MKPQQQFQQPQQQQQQAPANDDSLAAKLRKLKADRGKPGEALPSASRMPGAANSLSKPRATKKVRPAQTAVGRVCQRGGMVDETLLVTVRKKVGRTRLPSPAEWRRRELNPGPRAIRWDHYVRSR